MSGLFTQLLLAMKKQFTITLDEDTLKTATEALVTSLKRQGVQIRPDAAANVIVEVIQKIASDRQA